MVLYVVLWLLAEGILSCFVPFVVLLLCLVVLSTFFSISFGETFLLGVLF